MPNLPRPPPVVLCRADLETRKKRAMATIRDARKDMDWVVVRNRTQHVEARNQKRIDQALNELSAGGLPHSNGLSERVIYRELFPSGLTLLDKGIWANWAPAIWWRGRNCALVSGLNLPMPNHRAAGQATPLVDVA
jgi:chromosome partitioning protein